jgi:hypothetical protein
LLKADFRCGLVEGKLVCGSKKSSSNKNDDDDDDNDDDKPKKQGVDAGLTECTIQAPGGGGGCKSGFKRVCEKLKSGKKCCGCVADKNAQPPKKEAEPGPAPNGWFCEADVTPGVHQSYAMSPLRASTEAQARAVFAQEVKDRNNTITGPVTRRPN